MVLFLLKMKKNGFDLIYIDEVCLQIKTERTIFHDISEKKISSFFALSTKFFWDNRFIEHYICSLIHSGFIYFEDVHLNKQLVNTLVSMSESSLEKKPIFVYVCQAIQDSSVS